MRCERLFISIFTLPVLSWEYPSSQTLIFPIGGRVTALAVASISFDDSARLGFSIFTVRSDLEVIS